MSYENISDNRHVWVLLTAVTHFGAFTGVLKQLWGEAGAIEGHCVFGVGAWRRGAGEQRESIELLLQRQNNAITLQLRRVQRLSRKEEMNACLR